MRNSDETTKSNNGHPRPRTGKTARERAKRFNKKPVEPTKS